MAKLKGVIKINTLERLRNERITLTDRIKKMEKFIVTDKFYQLEMEQRILVDRQLDIMNEYCAILSRRIDLIERGKLYASKQKLNAEYGKTYMDTDSVRNHED